MTMADDHDDVTFTTLYSDQASTNNTSSSTSSSQSEVEQGLEAFILVVISIVGTVGNLSLFAIILGNRSLRTTSNALVLCLSAADLLVSCVNVPVAVVTVLNGGWALSSSSCTALGFLTMLTFIISVMSLAQISINRFFLICYPMKFKDIYTPTKTALLITGTLLLSAALASPPLLGWGVYAYLPGQSICFCRWSSSISYTFFMVGICFGGPCTIMSFCYARILHTVRLSKKRVMDSNGRIHKGGVGTAPKPAPSLTPVEPINNQTPKRVSFLEVPGANKAKEKAASHAAVNKDKKSQRRTQEELRLTASFLVVIFIFIISWLPFCITMFLSVFSEKPVPRVPDMLTLLLGCANSCYNPIIYGLMNTKFRQGFRRLYCEVLIRPFRRNRVAPINSLFSLDQSQAIPVTTVRS